MHVCKNVMIDKIQMVDLKNQYIAIKNQIDTAVINNIEEANFINGPDVKLFEKKLSNYLNIDYVISCGNGTDALQIALMSLNLNPGDEIICPAFNYVATAEVICLLGLTPVFIGVDSNTFNITAELIEKAITPKTKAIIPVHLYGQCCPMEEIIEVASKYNLFVIEDNAQSLGADYIFTSGDKKKAGTLGHIGCTSFFPSKILGCYGDGGAVFTNDIDLANKIRMISNHGQEKKYYHKILGCNSRLDTIQASILNIKIEKIDNYIESRLRMANYYNAELSNVNQIILPSISKYSTHVFHQYTIKVKNNKRDNLKKYLEENNISSMIYYPLPIYKQEAFKKYFNQNSVIEIVENLCSDALSLPIHTEQNEKIQKYICDTIKSFFN